MTDKPSLQWWKFTFLLIKLLATGKHNHKLFKLHGIIETWHKPTYYKNCTTLQLNSRDSFT